MRQFRLQRCKIRDRGDCTYTIQAAKGWYLAIGPNNTESAAISGANAPPSGFKARFELVMIDVWQ